MPCTNGGVAAVAVRRRRGDPGHLAAIRPSYGASAQWSTQLKGMRWTLLKDVFSLKPEAGAALQALLTAPRLTMTARAWAHKDRLRLAMEHKQINVLRRLLLHWCTCVMRSKIDAMKEVATQ